MAGARRVGHRWAGAVLACLLLLITLPSNSPKADEVSSEAADTVNALAAEIFSIRDQGRDASWRRRSLARAIEARTDIDLLSRLALGKHWRSLDDAVRPEYTSLFSMVVMAIWAIGSMAYSASFRVRWSSISSSSAARRPESAI